MIKRTILLIAVLAIWAYAMTLKGQVEEQAHGYPVAGPSPYVYGPVSK